MKTEGRFVTEVDPARERYERGYKITVEAISELSLAAESYEGSRTFDPGTLTNLTSRIDIHSLQHMLLRDAEAYASTRPIVITLQLSVARFIEINPFIDVNRNLGIRNLEENIPMILDQADARFGIASPKDTVDPSEERELKRRQEVARYLLDAAFVERISELLENEAMTYKQILRLMIRDGNDVYGGAAILMIARKAGKISPLLDGAAVSYLRHITDSNKGHLELTDNFITQVRQHAVQEDPSGAYRIQLIQASHQAVDVRKIEEKMLLGEKITEEESMVLKRFSPVRYDVVQNGHNLHAFAKYLYEDGSLRWLWGINDTDIFRSVLQKSEGGRVGDFDDVAW